MILENATEEYISGLQLSEEEKREKNLDKEEVYGKGSFDNLQRKIQVHF